LIGEYPETLARELQRTRAIPRLPARVPVGLPVDLLRRRPDIREAERLLAAAVAEVGARTADLFPSLVINRRRRAQDGPRSGSAVPITWIGSVGPSINASILDFGALDAKIEIADYRAHELAAVYKRNNSGGCAASRRKPTPPIAVTGRACAASISRSKRRARRRACQAIATTGG